VQFRKFFSGQSPLRSKVHTPENKHVWLVLVLAAAMVCPATGRAQTPIPLTGPSLGGEAEIDLSARVPTAVDIERLPRPEVFGLDVLRLEPMVMPPETSERIEKFAKKFGKKYDISKIGERPIGHGVNFYSLNKEQALGKQLATEVEQESRLVRDPVVTEYVNRLGQNLVRNSDAKVPFTIKVIDNDEVNAFALPGGYFYVNTGLILAADNEAELAGVMAHEIAHVAARHATKNATRGQIWNLASIPLIFLGGPVGYAIQQVAGFAVPMSFLKFSRDAEKEADLLGLEYQYATGYDPAAFVQFFEKLNVKDKHKLNFLAKAFSTHPMTADRIKRAQEEIEALLPPKPEYIVDTSEFEEVKSRLAELVNRSRLGDSNNVRPTLRKRGPEQDTTQDKKDDDGRPTLRRRTD
jgi:beta-barrel assembly-enhancing protease